MLTLFEASVFMKDSQVQPCNTVMSARLPPHLALVK